MRKGEGAVVQTGLKTGLSQRHLVVHHGALGDFVLALRVADRLEGEVLFVTTGDRARFLNRFEGWGVRGVDGEAAGFGAMFGSMFGERAGVGLKAREIVDNVSGTVVSFVSTGSDVWAENASRVFEGRRVVYVQPRPGAGVEEHVTKWQGEQVGGVVAARFAGVWTGGAGVVVHAGSGGRAKRWGVSRFSELSRRLKGEGIDVRWVAGRDDLEMEPGLERVMGEFDGEVLEGLGGLVDACLGARVWVGNDSGPSHVAGLLGAPTVALFGPTDARVWAPLGERVRVVAPAGGGVEGMGWLGVERVIQDVRCFFKA